MNGLDQEKLEFSVFFISKLLYIQSIVKPQPSQVKRCHTPPNVSDSSDYIDKR